MAKKKQRNGQLFTVILIVSIVVALPITYWILAAYGEKSGVEFSPDDFSMRSFDYCNLPYVNWTHRGIKYQKMSNAMADTLLADDWIRATGRTPKRWHLVSESGGAFSSKTSAACDARFLTNYFDQISSEGENQVSKWTDENPESAKIFWPIIADMARDDLYLPIPQLMEFVLKYKEPDVADMFQPELEDLVAEAWYQAGITDQLNGNHKRAIKRFDAAVESCGEHYLASKAKKESESASQ